MKVASFVLGAALALAPLSANAQVRVDLYASVVPGEAVGSVDVFYDQLSPYGVWVDDGSYGRLFLPSQADYLPYTNGHWEYTDVGFVWVSDEPFAWATSHYGRWFYSDSYFRWVWLPDTTWGPAWVEWREAADDFGWAPLAPQIVIAAGYQPPLVAWHYCPSAHIVDVDVVRYYEPRQRVATIHREAKPIQQYATVANAKVVVGPQATILRAHRVTVKPHAVQPKVVGRMSHTELQSAETRARERKPQIEQQNQRRIEADPKLREVVKTRATTRTPERQPQQPTTPPRAAPRPGVEQPGNQPRVEEPRRQAPKPKAQPLPQPQPKAQPQPQPKAQPQPRVMQPQPRKAQPRAEQRPPQPRAEQQPPRAEARPQQQPRQASPAKRPSQKR